MSHDLSKHPLSENLGNIKNVIAVMSGKGGVGKSTVATNLAVALSRKGFQTGLLDADLHGPSASRLLGMVNERIAAEGDRILPLEKDGLKVISIAGMMEGEATSTIWRGPMKIGVLRQFIADTKWGELDYLVIDLPPGTGDEPLTIAQDIPHAQAVIVTTPQEVSIIDVRKSITFCRKLGLSIAGIVENMGTIICPSCNDMITLFPGDGGTRLADEYNIPFLGSLPFEPAVAYEADAGGTFLADKRGKSGEVFHEIVTRILDYHEEQKKEAPMGESCTVCMPLEGGAFTSHFGHAEEMLFAEIVDGKVTKKEVATPPPHEPGVIPNWVADKGATIMLAGGMGAKAQQILAERGVQVVTGITESAPDAVLQAFIKNTLTTSDKNLCGHGEGHACSH